MNLDTASFGSYAFSSFTNMSRELERLEHQATLAWDLEAGLLDSHGLQRAQKVLDLACGPGVVTRRIAHRAPQARVIGLDFEPKLLEVAQNATPLSMSNCPTFLQGNVYELPRNLGRFDLVYARFLFQHLKDPNEVLREIRGVLNPQGRVLIVDVDDRDLNCEPAYGPFTDFVEQVAVAQREGGGDRMVGRKLPSLLERAGFTDIRAERVELNSRMFGLSKFFEITTAFKLEQLPREERHYHQERLNRILEGMTRSGSQISLAIHCVSAKSQ